MKFGRLCIICLFFGLKAAVDVKEPIALIDAKIGPDEKSAIMDAKTNTEIRSTSNPKIGDKCIKLDAPILSVIDGVKGFMDGEKIHKMLYLGRELNQFMYGTLDVNNKRVPQHVFKGKFYTLEQLVSIEEEIEKTKDKDPNQYQKDKAEIAKTLEKLKESFLVFTSKVAGDAKGSTEQTYMLIDNFIEKYGDSLLKYWRIDKDEVVSLHKRVTNFKLCYGMSYDLYHFLKAIICALPKAFQMYKDSQKQIAARSKL